MSAFGGAFGRCTAIKPIGAVEASHSLTAAAVYLLLLDNRNATIMVALCRV